MLESARIPVRLEAAPASAARLALVLIATFAAIKFGAHLLVTALTPYEIHRDEFLYLAMGEHLRLWRMDFPPLIAILAKTARAVFGDNLFAVRFFSAIAGTGLVILTGMLTYRLGGARRAQFLSMLAVLLGPLFLRPSVLFQPVIWDQLWWTLGFYALTLVLTGEDRRGWLLLGVTGGLGLLTKFSILFFAAGTLMALLLTSHRRAFLTRWPWLAIIIALMVGSPTLVGQVRLAFPVVIHMGDLQAHQLARLSYLDFVSGQLLLLGPAILLTLAGYIWLLISERAQPFRAIALSCMVTFLIVMLLRGKPYYIGPIYPALFAAGATCLDQVAGRLGTIFRSGVVCLIIVGGLVSLPFGLPILPPAAMAKYAERTGQKGAVTTNRGTVLRLPQDYADMLGWEDQVKAVARAFNSLPREQHQKTGLIADNYGEAGALEFYGPRHGLPTVVMLPHNYLLWPPDDTCTTVLTIGINPSDLQRFFKKVTVFEHFDNAWMVEEEGNVPVCIAEGPLVPVSSSWKPRIGWQP